MPDGLIMKYSFPPPHKSCHSFRLPLAVLPSAQPGIMTAARGIFPALTPHRSLPSGDPVGERWDAGRVAKEEKKNHRTTLRPRRLAEWFFIFIPRLINNRPIQSAALADIRFQTLLIAGDVPSLVSGGLVRR